MVAIRASKQQAPSGGANEPSRPGEGAQPPEPTERKGGTSDDVARSEQQEARKGEAGSQGFFPDELQEAREERDEEERREPLDSGRVCEDKGLER